MNIPLDLTDELQTLAAQRTARRLQTQADRAIRKAQRSWGVQKRHAAKQQRNQDNREQLQPDEEQDG